MAIALLGEQLASQVRAGLSYPDPGITGWLWKSSKMLRADKLGSDLTEMGVMELDECRPFGHHVRQVI